MNLITVFGDIHANLPALEAVLNDMDARGLTQRYCLGDLVGYGTEPNAVIERIRSLGIPTIMGNYD
jgi:predicted phosphodiesterase